jgi:hypothetical protein
MRQLPFRAAPTAALLLVALTACRHAPQAAPAPAPTPTPVRASYRTGEDVIAAMRARYDGKWYKTLTFSQQTSRLQPDGKWNVQTWYEAMKVPGRLRIDFDPISAGNGVVYANDSAYSFRNGRQLPAQASINPLLLLGFDVYANTPARTAAILRKEGFDLTRVHADSFQGRPMIVVGAHAGDHHTKQFWVDAERLYFVRMLEPTPRDSTKVQDVRFVKYRPEGDAWVAPRVEIHSDGKLVFFEDYSDIRANVPLDDDVFDPSKYKTAKHWVVP